MLATRDLRDAAVNDHDGKLETAVVAGLYLIFASAVTLTAGRSVRRLNYFLEWNVVCCVLVGLLIGQVLGRGNRWHRRATATAIVLVPGVAGLARLEDSVRYWDIATGQEASLKKNAADSGQALAIIQATPGLVLSDDVTLLAKAGRKSRGSLRS
jgi:hypothetical protein